MMQKIVLPTIVCAFLYLATGLLAAAGAPVSIAHTGGTSTVHFRPEKGVLGDVIPFYWQGTYHVFYLKGSAWGHIACEDLVHWRQLPDAISKGEGATAPDGENCWTGSIVEDSGTFHLFYTGKNSRDPKGDQKVMHAVSRDLTAWTKQPERTFYADGVNYWSKPVNGDIDDKLIYHHQAFRDPEVVRVQGEGKWWLLLHAALPDGSAPAFARYESDDLMRWTPCKPLVVLPKTLSADCPHLFETRGKWHLLAADRHYTSAASPEGPFPTEMLPYDCGELFVPKTMHDGRQRILMGWIGDREGGRDAGKGVWGGVMCMPRELYADDRDRLCQRPAGKVMEAYSKTAVRLDDGLGLGQAVDVPPNYMMHCRIKAAAPNTEAVVVMRAASDNPDSGYRLKIRFGDRKVSLGDPYRMYERECDFDAGVPVDVRVFLADTVIECFLNDAYCFTMRGYDSATGGLRIEAASGGLAVADFEVKTLPQ